MHVCSVHIINILVRIAVMWITRRRSNKCQRHFFNDVFKTSSFENFLCLRETILYGAYFVQNGCKTIKTFETTFRGKGAISISLPLKVSVFGVFWSVFSHIRTEYGEIRIKMRENQDQKNSEHGHFPCSVLIQVSKKSTVYENKMCYGDFLDRPYNL